MSIVSSIRTMFSGQTQEAFGEGERHPLTKEMDKEIRRHIAALRKSDLSAYKFERRHSNQPGAKSDIVIYDETEKSVIVGRDMDGHLSFWTP